MAPSTMTRERLIEIYVADLHRVCDGLGDDFDLARAAPLCEDGKQAACGSGLRLRACL